MMEALSWWYSAHAIQEIIEIIQSKEDLERHMEEDVTAGNDGTFRSSGGGHENHSYCRNQWKGSTAAFVVQYITLPVLL